MNCKSVSHNCPPILICRHDPNDTIGLLEDILQYFSLDYQLFDYFRITPTFQGEYAALIVLGGSQSANDPSPWLANEYRLIERTLAQRKPVLGICLGAQMLAKTLGATVTANPVPEIGWFPIHPTPDAASDPLLQHVNHTPLFHWHAETFQLPRSAQHLAFSDRCEHQAFRYGDTAWGLQFHLEITPEMLHRWLSEDAACAHPEVHEPIPTGDHFTTSQPIAQRILAAWCNILCDQK